MVEKPKVVMHRLDEIVEDFFVRMSLDQDYVVKLAVMVESGVDLDPIEITKDGRLVEGRHRKAAYELAGRVEIPAVIIADRERVDMLAYALSRNEGGPKPMGEEDVVYTITQMLESKASEKRVYDVLERDAGYTRSFIRKFLDKAKQQTKRRRLQTAKMLVVDNGMTISSAAEQQGVDASDLKKYIKGPEKKPSSSAEAAALMKKEITGRTLACQRGCQSVIKRIVQGYIDGTVADRIVDEVFDHLDQKIKMLTKSRDEWRKRYNAAKGGEMVNWTDKLPHTQGETTARAA